MRSIRKGRPLFFCFESSSGIEAVRLFPAGDLPRSIQGLCKPMVVVMPNLNSYEYAAAT